MSVQRISPKSAKQWKVSPPFGSRWRKRRRLIQNCFWIDINEQIYLLNTLWLFNFYVIIVSQFSCNQMKLDRKRKSEIIFWRQNFHFRGYSYQPYATDLSITFSVLQSTERVLWFQSTISKFCDISITLGQKIDLKSFFGDNRYTTDQDGLKGGAHENEF